MSKKLFIDVPTSRLRYNGDPFVSELFPLAGKASGTSARLLNTHRAPFKCPEKSCTCPPECPHWPRECF